MGEIPPVHFPMIFINNENSTAKSKKIKRILELENLSFIADKPIIDSITWNVDEGQRWVLLGANGAGKTSLISTLCAYNTPSSGRMCVDGKEYSNFNWQKCASA